MIKICEKREGNFGILGKVQQTLPVTDITNFPPSPQNNVQIPIIMLCIASRDTLCYIRSTIVYILLYYAIAQ